MKFKVTHEVFYDTTDADFLEQFDEWCIDYPKTFENLEEFIKDRFIDPNFDKGETTIEITEI